MTNRRVVITGIGVINALGIGREEYFQGLWEGRVGIDRIKAFVPDGFPSRVGGEHRPVKLNKIVPKSQRKSIKLMSHDILLAVVAADAAFRDSGLKTRGTHPEEPSDIEPRRSGVNIGAGLICCDLNELAEAAENAVEDGRFSLQKWGREGMQTLTPLWLLKYLPNMLNCHITIIHDLQGPSNCLTCAEVSGALSIGEGYLTVARGRADLIVAGGAESKVNPMNLLRQSLFNRISTHYNERPEEACRPFDREADGSVVGDGGAVVILEELEHARKRGARIFGEITGFGAANDFSKDFIRPEEDGGGMVIAMRKALQKGEVKPEDIDLLVPHGIAVPDHDQAEYRAVKQVFGDYSGRLPVLAVKSRIGNCGAGSSAIDFVSAVLALSEGRIPATINCPNPAFDLHIVRENTEAELKYVMTNSYTHGGQTAALLVRRWED